MEYDRGIPRNPFVNAGAIVVCDILVSRFENPSVEVLEFVRSLSGNNKIDFNLKVAYSERSMAYRNYALVNLMKSFGNIKNDIEKVMDLYFKICSIEMTCRELSESFLFLANNGVVPYSGKPTLQRDRKSVV